LKHERGIKLLTLLLILLTVRQLLTPAQDERSICMPLEPSTSNIPRTFKLSVFNAAKQENDQAKQLVVQLISDSHITIIQEAVANTPDQTQPTRYHQFAEGYRSGDVQSGVSIWSATPAHHRCAATTIEPWLHTPKATLATRYTLDDGSELIVANVHAINFTTDRRQFARQIAKLVEFTSGDQPAVIAGDFNTWSVQRTKLMQQVLTKAGFKQASFKPDHRIKPFLGLPLDHLWYRKLELRHATTLETDSSDHNPLIAEFVVLNDTQTGSQD